jgi:hypothetical protein
MIPLKAGGAGLPRKEWVDKIELPPVRSAWNTNLQLLKSL